MRITQNMMSRGYIRRMNQNLSGLAGSNNRLSSGTKYTRVSENTSEAMRAFAVREQLYMNEQYSTNIKNAQSELSAAEGNLQMVNTALQNVENRLIQANTGTVSDNERQLIAKELEGLQDQILQISNAKFNDKFVFAGSGNDGGKAPFTVGANGQLSYNGYKVSEITYNKTTGDHEVPNPDYDDTDPDSPQFVKINYNKDVYLDMGMGMEMTGTGADRAVDPKSAFKISTSGLEAFGFGVDADGMPKNVYSLIGKTIEDIKSGNTTDMDADMKAIRGTYDSLMMAVTDVGTRSSYLEDTWNRMDSEAINLKTTQQALEAVPMEEEVMYNKSYEMSWMVTLQLGSKIIPPSIFDFIR